MRGEFGEQNPWQIPMGNAVETCLSAMGTRCIKIESEQDISPSIEAAVNMAYISNQPLAVLLSQKLIGAKPF
jgi:sulfopyruvate decarboxylase TPP-binding subunit